MIHDTLMCGVKKCIGLYGLSRTFVVASDFHGLFYCIGLSRTFFIASDFHGLLRTFVVVRVRPLQIYFCVYLRFLRDLKIIISDFCVPLKFNSCHSCNSCNLWFKKCIGLYGLSRTFFIASDFHGLFLLHRTYGLLRTFVVVRVRPLQIYFCVYLRFLRDLKIIISDFCVPLKFNSCHSCNSF